MPALPELATVLVGIVIAMFFDDHAPCHLWALVGCTNTTSLQSGRSGDLTEFVHPRGLGEAFVSHEVAADV
jgi:hypothetical protein